MSDDGSPKHAGVHYPPPLLYVAGIAAGWLMHRVRPLPITGHPSALRAALALAFGLGWLALFAPALSGFLAKRTTIIPNRPAAALVTSGIYRHTRNPMYVSLVLLYIAVTLVLDSWWPVVFLPLVIVAVDRLIIRREERYLADAFPSEYPAYCERVRRWV
jgi:protein-S-isoprenylcysteine O-methyltransferase Ste14